MSPVFSARRRADEFDPLVEAAASGRAVDDARVRVALTLAPTGLNASVTGPGADWLVVPTYVGRKDGAHVTYDTADAPRADGRSTGQRRALMVRPCAADRCS